MASGITVWPPSAAAIGDGPRAGGGVAAQPRTPAPRSAGRASVALARNCASRRDSAGGGDRLRSLRGGRGRLTAGPEELQREDEEPDAAEQQRDAHHDREQRALLREVRR